MQALFSKFLKFLFAYVGLDHLAQIPEHCDLLLSLNFTLFGLIFHVNSVRATIAAFNLNIPTALMNNIATTAANGAIFQNVIRIYFHLYLSP
jgi:hypothetical protein